MKLIKCINNNGLDKYLTIGKIYDVIGECYNDYIIYDDKNEYCFYRKNKFEEVQLDQPKEQCKNKYCESYNEDCNNNCQIDNFNECSLPYSDDLIKPNYYNKVNGISPFEFIKANNLDFFEGNVIKYITRYKEKNGLEDLKKAKTYLEEVIKNYQK